MFARKSFAATIASLAVVCVVALVTAQAAIAVEAPAVEDQWVVDVSATSATLLAQVNPREGATSYRFEYGPSTSYGASAPLPEGEIGAGSSGVKVSAHVQGLSPATVYHYRVVANSPGGTTLGPDLTFTTQPPGEELALPDGRQWELVSPPDKHGALIEAGRREGGPIQAALDGGKFTYVASAPVTDEALGSRSPEPSQVLSMRGLEGWSTQDIATPNTKTSNIQVGKGDEYRLFSADLSLAALEPRIVDNGPLSPEATEWTPYLREDATGLYRPLVTAANVLPGTEFGGSEDGEIKVEGASPDLRHVVLSSKIPLLEGAVSRGLYEWSNGQLQFVSVLPEGTPTEAALGGSRNPRNAVSPDGSLVVWSTGHVYVRDVPLGQTVRLDVLQPGAPAGEEPNATYEMASADTRKVFFTANKSLMPGAGSGDLYRCEMEVVAGQLTCQLADVSQGLYVTMVLGASDDGSYVYFTHGEEIYLAHDGTISQVAQSALAEYELSRLPARVSHNGRYLAFMSTQSLTGYDNRDAVSGERDTEVYLYDAVSGGVRCVSCNPTGARPAGLYLGEGKPMVNRPDGFNKSTWLSGSVPPWNSIALVEAQHQPAYLSDSGRVFFDSSEALVPQDVNGLEDAYEYEPQGVGDCVRTGGCLALISSGSSLEESVFLDASENGDDVFFAAGDRLTAQDFDHALDVYDAHVCGASAPCASLPATPPPCTTADSCRAAVSPQPPIFGSPPSATFSGLGNVSLVPIKADKAKHKPHKHKSHKHKSHKRKRNKRKRHKAKASAGRKVKTTVKSKAAAGANQAGARRGA